MDLTVAAIPFYFASMEAERRWLQRQAKAGRPSPADFESKDTAASLTMGVGSLLLPMVTNALVAKVLPGRGRFPKVLVRTTVAAAVATTVADHVARTRPARRRGARRVAAAAGPVAVAAGSVAAASTIRDRTAPARLWEQRRRDLGGGLVANAI